VGVAVAVAVSSQVVTKLVTYYYGFKQFNYVRLLYKVRLGKRDAALQKIAYNTARSFTT